MLKRFVLAGLVLLAMSGHGFGAIVLYSFTDTTGAPTSVTAPIPGVTFGTIAMTNQTTGFTSPGFTAPGTVATAISTTSASTGYTVPITASGLSNIGTGVSNLALDPATSAFFSLPITNAGAGALQLETIGFGARSTGTGATTISVRSSVDSFASNIATFTLTANSAWAGFNNTLPVPFSLGSGDVTLRLYASGGGSTAAPGTINTRLDDIQLSVTAVPEPTSMALVGMVGVAGLVTRYRRKFGSVSSAT